MRAKRIFKFNTGKKKVFLLIILESIARVRNVAYYCIPKFSELTPRGTILILKLEVGSTYDLCPIIYVYI